MKLNKIIKEIFSLEIGNISYNIEKTTKFFHYIIKYTIINSIIV